MTRAIIDGNEAAASVAYRLNELCSIYPITPSSTMAELGNKQSGIKQLETLRAQAKDAALAMRAAQQKVSGLEANIAGQDGGATTKQARELAGEESFFLSFAAGAEPDGAAAQGALASDLERGAARAAEAYGRLADFLESELAPLAPEADAVGRHLAGGRCARR